MSLVNAFTHSWPHEGVKGHQSGTSPGFTQTEWAARRFLSSSPIWFRNVTVPCSTALVFDTHSFSKGISATCYKKAHSDTEIHSRTDRNNCHFWNWGEALQSLKIRPQDPIFVKKTRNISWNQHFSSCGENELQILILEVVRARPGFHRIWTFFTPFFLLFFLFLFCKFSSPFDNDAEDNRSPCESPFCSWQPTPSSDAGGHQLRSGSASSRTRCVCGLRRSRWTVQKDPLGPDFLPQHHHHANSLTQHFVFERSVEAFSC